MVTDFSNSPVDVSGLPHLADENFVSLDRNYLRVSLIGNAIFATIAIVACAIVATRVERVWIPLVVLVVLLALSALSAGLRAVEVRNMGYQVRQHDISYRRGVIGRSTVTLPFVRVQHARLNRGFIERQFGLATVHVNTAGSSLTIPGLRVDDAERIKALVVERAGDLTET